MLRTRSSFDDARYPVGGSRAGCEMIGWDWSRVKKSGSVTPGPFTWISPYHGLFLRIFFTCSIEFDWLPDQGHQINDVTSRPNLVRRLIDKPHPKMAGALCFICSCILRLTDKGFNQRCASFCDQLNLYMGSGYCIGSEHIPEYGASPPPPFNLLRPRPRASAS